MRIYSCVTRARGSDSFTSSLDFNETLELVAAFSRLTCFSDGLVLSIIALTLTYDLRVLEGITSGYIDFL